MFLCMLKLMFTLKDILLRNLLHTFVLVLVALTWRLTSFLTLLISLSVCQMDEQAHRQAKQLVYQYIINKQYAIGQTDARIY